MFKILCGARDSALSQAQFFEVQKELQIHQPKAILVPVFLKTLGDRDKHRSLRDLGKSDFFTRELDLLLLNGQIRIAVHSAKDLPDPIPKGLSLIALTAGVDPRDCLVLRQNEDLSCVKIVATSSESREERVRQILPRAIFIDLRGTIQERLELLQRGDVDGVVMAEAALVRLNLRYLNRIFLPPPHTEHQGKLAILARTEDVQMKHLFRPLDKRGVTRQPWTILYLGLDPSSCEGRVVHYPVIRTAAIPEAQKLLLSLWEQSTHLIFTSKRAIAHLPDSLPWKGKRIFVVGSGTASLLPQGVDYLCAQKECQEGIIELIEQEDCSNARFLWPRSIRSRTLLSEYLRKKGLSAEVIDLYNTFYHSPGVPPSLEEVDELVFTSPSCIEGFVQIYGVNFSKKKIRFQGAITEEAWKKNKLLCCRSII